MTISSLSNLSLANYLYGNGSSTSSGATSLASYLGGGSGGSIGSAIGDMLTLSPAAQSLMSQQSVSNEEGEKARQGAKEYLVGFLHDSGVDISKLSDDAMAVFQGIDDMIADMGNAAQDTAVDQATAAFVKGQRQSYTLKSDTERMSFTVQYENGKPASMTVTHIQGSAATTAVISLTKDSSGNLSGLHIESTQKNYSSSGTKIGSMDNDALDMKLYA
ncbi:MAG TPA: hypothetical protein VIN59_09855 [Alphaproteobacteria bacterium]